MLRPIGHPSRVRKKLSITSRRVGVEIVGVLIGSKYMGNSPGVSFPRGNFPGRIHHEGEFAGGDLHGGIFLVPYTLHCRYLCLKNYREPTTIDISLL